MKIPAKLLFHFISSNGCLAWLILMQPNFSDWWKIFLFVWIFLDGLNDYKQLFDKKNRISKIKALENHTSDENVPKNKNSNWESSDLLECQKLKIFLIQRPISTLSRNLPCNFVVILSPPRGDAHGYPPSPVLPKCPSPGIQAKCKNLAKVSSAFKVVHHQMSYLGQYLTVWANFFSNSGKSFLQLSK